MDISARTERRTSRAVETGGADGHGSRRLRSVRAGFRSRLSEGDDYTAEASTRRGPEFWRDAAYSIRHTPCRYSLLTASVCRTGQLPDWPYGSNRQKRCPKSSATSIGLRTHTLATIADRISHSHPAFTVAGATRIQHHCGTCGDHDATGCFCSALPAHMSRPIPHRSSQFSRPPFFCHSFSRALLRANSCVRQLRVFCFPGSALHHWVPSDKAAARFGSNSLLGAPRKWGKKKEKIQLCLTSTL